MPRASSAAIKADREPRKEFARLAFFAMARKLWSSCAEELSAKATATHAASVANSATHAATHAKPEEADTEADAFHDGGGRRSLVRWRSALHNYLLRRLLVLGLRLLDPLLRGRRRFLLDMLLGRQQCRLGRQARC